MTAGRGSSRLYVLLLGSMLAIECTSLAPPTNLSGSPASSRDGLLRYRIPTGWFDVSADSQARGHMVWLVCSDLGSTLTLDEVHIDVGTRARLEEGFLVEVARLVRTLRAGREDLVDLSSSERIVLGGKDVCVTLLGKPSTGEKQRLMFLNTGRKLYLVTLVMAERVTGVREKKLFGAQDLFVQSLQGQW